MWAYAYNQRDKNVSSDAFYLELTGPSVDPVTGLPLQVIPTDALRDPVMINIGGIQQGVVSLGCAEHHGHVRPSREGPVAGPDE